MPGEQWGLRSRIDDMEGRLMRLSQGGRLGLAIGAMSIASLGFVACGDDGGDDVAAYCDLSAELDAQGTVPSLEQLDEIASLAPDEISDEVDTVVEIFKAEGEAAFSDPELEEAFVSIDEFEAENCDQAEGS